MDDNILPQSVAGAGNAPFRGTDGGIWNSLQCLKEEVFQELIGGGPLYQNEAGGGLANEASAFAGRDGEWIHRAQLETRLRDINYAQDRLLDGTYGKCVDCGKQMGADRLATDPAASLCCECQRVSENKGFALSRPLCGTGTCKGL